MLPDGWSDGVLLGGAVVTAVIVAWLVVLTALVVRRRQGPDEPVYRRLPDGRIRFTWHIAQGLGRAQRTRSADVDLRARS